MNQHQSEAPHASWSARILGVGSLAFAAWALAAPRPFAAFMGVPAAWGRWLGARDLIIGSAVLLWPGPAAFAMRAVADASDAATARKPRVAAGAAGFGLWALTAALAARRSESRTRESTQTRTTDRASRANPRMRTT